MATGVPADVLTEVRLLQSSIHIKFGYRLSYIILFILLRVRHMHWYDSAKQTLRTLDSYGQPVGPPLGFKWDVISCLPDHRSTPHRCHEIPQYFVIAKKIISLGGNLPSLIIISVISL